MILKNIKYFIGIVFLLLVSTVSAQYVENSSSLNQAGAIKLADQAIIEAQKIDKNVSVAVLNNAGVTLLLLKADNVGVHNTEASRRKAYTAISTKTSSFDLMKKAAADATAHNLNTLPELLLLGGGVPIWDRQKLVGSIGVSGAGGGENDHNIAKNAVESIGFKIRR